MSEHFGESLFGCAENASVCLFVCCVPGGGCCVQAKAVDIVKKDGMIVPYLLICFLACFGAAINRGTIRHKLNIKGSYLNDCLIHWCCGLCAVCQEYREVKGKHKH